MSLRTINEHCSEMITLIKHSVKIDDAAERERIDERVLSIMQHTRELIGSHNDLIMANVDNHHKNNALPLTPLEHFTLNFHLIEEPRPDELVQPTTNADLEKFLATLPEHLRETYRFAHRVANDVHPLLQEARIVQRLHLNEEEHLVLDVD